MSFSKKLLAVFLSVCLAACLSAPLTALAAKDENGGNQTLGTETPKIYCEYQNSLGEVADGNALEAGTEYSCSFKLSGVTAVARLQLVIAVDVSKAAVGTFTSIMSDSYTTINTDMSDVSNTKIVFAAVSTNSVCSGVEEDAVLFTLPVTPVSACDAASIFTADESPDYTFLETEHGDSKECYALNTSYPGYEYATFPMEIDYSPVLPVAGYDVSGNIYVMTTVDGSTASKPVPYTCTLTVADAEGRTVTEVQSDAVNDGTKFTSNTYTIPALADGTYTVTVTGEFAVTRTVTLVVNGAAIENADIPLCACNYNTAKEAINASDTRAFNIAYSSGSFTSYPAYDLNGDGKINATDARLVNVFFAVGTVTYPDLVLQ